MLTEPSQKHCLYIAPYRALVNEIEDRLADTLGALGYRVSNLAGGFEFDNFQNFLAVESHVLVTTPEKADLLFRTHPEYFENISTIVIDEGHMVDEGVPSQEELKNARKTLAEELAQRGTLGRGTLLEILISRLKQKLPQAHFLFLSAVMPDVNADDFVNWLSKNSQKPLKVEKAARPSRQTIVSFKWLKAPEEKGGYDGRLEYFNTEGTHTFVHYFLQRELYYTGEFMRNGGLKTITWPNVENKVQTTAMLVIKFASNGSVLVFCAMPYEVKNVVENILKSLKYYEADGRSVCDGLKYIEDPNLESFDLAKEWLGDDHPLTRGLHYGVGLHYGPLPDPVRQAVEDDFRAGKITVLVSTTTLGQGVNLPVKTAIIYSLERKFPDEKLTHQKEKVIVDPVKKRDFWNMCGRAGRAGIETEGQIVFVAPSNHDNSLFNTFRNEDRIEPVESPLYKLLKALVEKRISQDTLVNYLDAPVLTLLAEEVVNTEDEAAISNFLKTSLVGVQAMRNNIALTPLVSAIKRTAIRINQEVPDQTLRTIFASTGLQVKSCKMLESAVELFLSLRGWDVSEEEEGNLYLDEELLEFALEACQRLPEMQPTKGTRVPKPEDELKFVKDWVKGKPISEIRSLSWTSEQEDDFGDYIADRVIYKLPWGFNGFLRIVAFKLQKKYDELPLCWICSFGVSSRQLALEVARHYPMENGSSFRSFVKWVVNLPTEFLFQELTVGSIAEKKRLMEKISRIVADDSQLQFILQRQTVLESRVQGIRYDNRADAAIDVPKGDQLLLQADPDNPHDPWAIRVLFNGQHIGYVQRDKAKIISREMQLGRAFQAHAKKITPPLLNYPYPDIVMTITG